MEPPTTTAPTTTTPTTTTPTMTAPPTTALPTMAPPMMAPTTMAPTTMAPTTIAPTSLAPPTSAPPTLAPPTSAPTTMEPTTIAQTIPTAPPTTTTMAIIRASVHRLDHRLVLRKSVAILGWSLLIFSPFYLLLGCLVCIHVRGGKIGNASPTVGSIVYVMTFLYGASKMSLGVMLLCAAQKESVRILTMSLGFTLFVGIYGVLLGCLGVIFFFMTAHITFNFLTGLLYLFIAFTILEVLCVDVVIIDAYTRELKGPVLARTPQISQ